MSLFDQAVGGEDPGQANDYIFESDSASTKHDQIRDHDKQQQSPKHVKALVGIRSQEFSVESSENYKGKNFSFFLTLWYFRYEYFYILAIHFKLTANMTANMKFKH